MKLPTHEQIMELWDKFKVPNNVRDHMRMVTKVAVFIAEKFKENGIDVNIDLIEKASLLHDLIKVCNFKTFDHTGYREEPPTKEELLMWTEIKGRYGSMHHADAGCEVLKERYPELANTVRLHNYALIGKEDGPKSWEDKIVNYADKRVTHDKVVTIAQRHADAIKRYRDDQMIVIENENYKKLQELEDEIFSEIGTRPEDLLKLNEE